MKLGRLFSCSFKHPVFDLLFPCSIPVRSLWQNGAGLMEQPESMGVFPEGASLLTQTYLILCPLLQEDTMEESGWKLVHGDVFRPPQYPMILSSLLGSGIQLFCMILIVICEWTM